MSTRCTALTLELLSLVGVAVEEGNVRCDPPIVPVHLTLAVSGGAVFLLPFSIISNEILLSFPKNYYIQWLNGSLIHGLWNLVSLFSNLCLFVLMPFAYFFLESEGFAGSKKVR
ncbi:hypothetical protein KUCAC02_017630 [Chaenocephalus aceratus]|uniref:Uncharacterized protein n=1 Tax=Chaenocephalus aceratus TaxID=36190 RepID=A0ACB9W2X2_CHAAC|nr:hypothetical protein KUCAC02_017630 [Chaenocephalus aceratus]